MKMWSNLALALAVLVASLAASDKLDESRRLLNEGKAPEAIDLLKSAVEADPADGEAQELLAKAYLHLNKIDEARDAVQKAMEAAPDRSSVRVTAARVAIARQDWKAADQELNKAKEIESANSEISLYRGALLLARKDYKGAVEVLSPYVASYPESAHGHYYIGLAQYGLKRRDKTVEHFQRFLALAPNAPEASRVESLLRSLR